MNIGPYLMRHHRELFSGRANCPATDAVRIIAKSKGERRNAAVTSLMEACRRRGIDYTKERVDEIIATAIEESKDAPPIVQIGRTCVQCGRRSNKLDRFGVCLVCRNAVRLAKLNGTSPPKPVSKIDIDDIRLQMVRASGAARTGTRTRRRVGGMFTPHPNTPEFVTFAQRDRDMMKLAGMIPEDVDTIIGVARSGLSVAVDVALMLQKPIIVLRQTLKDCIPAGNGWRLGGVSHVEPKLQHVCVVDDTVMTGNSLRSIAPVVSGFKKVTTATLYVNPRARLKPDIFVRHLPAPHLLEWNLFNSIYSGSFVMDFDGILCRNPRPGEDDDGPRYMRFIETAEPKYVAKKAPIPMIVTARIEKYREPTEDWLSRKGIRWNELIMHSAETLSERNRDDIAAYKAKHFKRFLNTSRAIKPLMFIESEDTQARRISELSGGLTVCPGSGTCYQGSDTRRVFGVDMPRTGTASLCKSLDILGFFTCHCPVTIEEMLRYEASADLLVADSVEMLVKKFPDAKFILTIRDFDEWIDSYRRLTELQLKLGHPKEPQIKRALTHVFPDGRDTDTKLKEAYYRQVSRVNYSVPVEQLLKFDCSSGWKPLCRFLGLPVPKKSFPHANNRDFEACGFRSPKKK